MALQQGLKNKDFFSKQKKGSGDSGWKEQHVPRLAKKAQRKRRERK